MRAISDMIPDGTSFALHLYEGTPVPSAPETDDNISPSWANSESRNEYIAVRGEFDINEQLTTYAAVGTRDHDSSIVNPYTDIIDGEGNLYVYPYQEAYFANTKWSAETGLRLTTDTGPVNHRMVLSGSGISFDVGWRGTYDEGFTPLPEYESNLYEPANPAEPDLSNIARDPDVQVRNKLTGISLIDTLSIEDGRYQAMLGVRRQKFEIERLYDPENPYNDSARSPSVGLLAKVTPTLSVYGNYLVGKHSSMALSRVSHCFRSPGQPDY